jgi:hypothetical protein
MTYLINQVYSQSGRRRLGRNSVLPGYFETNRAIFAPIESAVNDSVAQPIRRIIRETLRQKNPLD